MAIITTSGGEFRDGVNRFRFIGVNNYPLVQNEYSVEQLNSFFNYCNTDGIKVVRCWAFNKVQDTTNQSGNNRYLNATNDGLEWREDWFVALDNVLDRAAAYGVKIALTLVDNYPQFNNWGIKQQYCYWSNTINSNAYDRYNQGNDFYLQADMKAWFKEYIAKLCGRTNTVNAKAYATDDTIFAWEIGNELRLDTNTDTNPNTVSSWRLTTLTAWYSEMAAYIKSQDANHMVSSGGISQYLDWVADDPVHNGTYYGLDYDLQHQDANIDFYDFHLYAYADSPTFTLNAYGQSLGESGGTAGLLAQLQEFIADAKTAGKPVVVGEWGIDKRNEDVATYVAYPRVTHFTNLYADFFGMDGDGLMTWHYTNLFDDNNYNIYPAGDHTGDNANSNLNDSDTTLRAVMAAQAAALAGTAVRTLAISRSAVTPTALAQARSAVSTPRTLVS